MEHAPECVKNNILVWNLQAVSAHAKGLLARDTAVIAETNPPEVSATEEDEAVLRLLTLADKMIELSQQERKRLETDVEVTEAQEDLQGGV